MAHLKLYSDPSSPPCRSVLLTTTALGIEPHVESVQVSRRETITDEFRNLNVQHTVPTLDDQGFILWDSHAIMCYIVDKYGQNDILYPRDVVKRARVHQRLHFNSGILSPISRDITLPIIYEGETTVDEKKKESLAEAYKFLDQFLTGQKWLAGDDHYTIADISCVTSVTSLDFFLPISVFPNIVRWVKACEREIPGYERINKHGNRIFREMFERLLLQ